MPADSACSASEDGWHATLPTILLKACCRNRLTKSVVLVEYGNRVSLARLPRSLPDCELSNFFPYSSFCSNRGNFFTRCPVYFPKAQIDKPLTAVTVLKSKLDRRSFLRVAGTSQGIGALCSVLPTLARGERTDRLTCTLAQLNGEVPAPFSFMQLSDTHVGFNGPPDPRNANPRCCGSSRKLDRARSNAAI